MKHILFLMLPVCTTYYPMRRTYGSCDAFLDRLNLFGGPFMLFILIVLFIIIRAIVMRNKK